MATTLTKKPAGYYRLRVVTIELDEFGRKVWTEQPLCEGRFSNPDECLADAQPYMDGRTDVYAYYPVLVGPGVHGEFGE